MSDEDARKAFDNLNLANENSSLEECFGQINQQLSKSFGLEITTVVVDSIKYHCIINLHADDVAKNSFVQHHFNPHEMALLRLIFQKLVDNGPTARKDLVNLRGGLEEPYKLTLQQAEAVVEKMLEEKWLRIDASSEENAKRRRESLQVTLELAPRSYLELSHTLTDMGYPKEDMPQFLIHRV